MDNNLLSMVFYAASVLGFQNESVPYLIHSVNSFLDMMLAHKMNAGQYKQDCFLELSCHFIRVLGTGDLYAFVLWQRWRDFEIYQGENLIRLSIDGPSFGLILTQDLLSLWWACGYWKHFVLSTCIHFIVYIFSVALKWEIYAFEVDNTHTVTLIDGFQAWDLLSQSFLHLNV